MNPRWMEQYTVTFHDTDYNGVIRASNLLRYHQETAHRQMAGVGPNEDLLRERGQAFLLSRVTMQIYRPLREGDVLEVATWACPSRAFSFYRCGEIRQNGETAAELISTWALVDIVSRRLLKVSDTMPDFPTDACPEGLALKFRIPPELPLTTVGKHTVGYGMTDRNCHMNNTFYPDLLCDFYEGGMDGRRVSAFSVNYIHEAKLGETVTVERSSRDADAVCRYRTRKADGSIGVEAEMQTVAIEAVTKRTRPD